MSKTSTAVIRDARLEDVARISEIVNYWAERGEMLPRRTEEIARTIRDFAVAEDEGRVVGCGALALYGADLAEIRSLAVSNEDRGVGTGRALVEHLVEEARAIGLPRVVAFTYVPAFFERLAFRVVAPESLPQKAWRDCIHCPKRTCCDEIAVVRDLRSPSTNRVR